MATVFWKGKQWVAQWYRADGTRKKRGTGIGKGQRREAERSAAEMESKDRKEKSETGRMFEEIISRAGADAKAGRMNPDRATEYLNEIRKVSDPSFRVVSLDAHLASWCESKAAHISASSSLVYSDMKRSMSNALGASILKAPLSELTKQQVTKAAIKMKADGLKGATINLHVRILRQALKQAVEDGLITSNPAAGVERMPETDSVERAPFDPDEVRQMIDHEATSDEWAGMILFGGHTGLRLGDVAKLGRDHVDGTDLVIRPKKTARKKVTLRIPLTPPLLRWIGERKGLFFPYLSTKSASTLSTQFSRIMEKSGIPSKITLPGGIEASRSFHSLRHSFTSWLANADIHSDVRKKLTGHSSEGIHAKYTHHDEALSRAVKTLPDIGSSRENSG